MAVVSTEAPIPAIWPSARRTGRHCARHCAESFRWPVEFCRRSFTRLRQLEGSLQRYLRCYDHERTLVQDRLSEPLDEAVGEGIPRVSSACAGSRDPLVSRLRPHGDTTQWQMPCSETSRSWDDLPHTRSFQMKSLRLGANCCHHTRSCTNYHITSRG